MKTLWVIGAKHPDVIAKPSPLTTQVNISILKSLVIKTGKIEMNKAMESRVKLFV